MKEMRICPGIYKPRSSVVVFFSPCLGCGRYPRTLIAWLWLGLSQAEAQISQSHRTFFPDVMSLSQSVVIKIFLRINTSPWTNLISTSAMLADSTLNLSFPVIGPALKVSLFSHSNISDPETFIFKITNSLPSSSTTNPKAFSERYITVFRFPGYADVG